MTVVSPVVTSVSTHFSPLLSPSPSSSHEVMVITVVSMTFSVEIGLSILVMESEV